MLFGKRVDEFKEGVFSAQEIKELINNSAIYSSQGIQDSQVKPAGLDATISSIAWKVPAALLFKENESMKNLDDYFNRFKPDENGFFILEPGRHYIFLLNESIDLALYPNVYVRANPKSSIGRIDLFARMITDSHNRFDYLKPGYRGLLGILLESKTFKIGLKESFSLNQLRFQIGNPVISTEELHKRYIKDKLLLDTEGIIIPKHDVQFDNGLLLSLNLNSPIYSAKKNVEEIIYLDRDRNIDEQLCHDPFLFFEKVMPLNNEYVLRRGDFILACTDEIISFPPDTCGDLESYNDQLGPDARIDYAGFVDPNWKSRLTYEIRTNEDLRLVNKMILARIFYYKLRNPPEILYGKEIGSHYGKNLNTYAELPRFFQTWEYSEEKRQSKSSRGRLSESIH